MLRRRSLPGARASVARVAAAGMLTVLAAGCGRSTDPTSVPQPTMSTTASSTASSTVPATAPDTTAAAATDPPSTAAPSIDVPATSAPGPATVEIAVSVGTDSGPDRREVVALGDTVVLRLVNPQAEDEFHLHGYDLGDGAEVPAGQEVTFTFTADTAGEFELESHVTHGVIMILEVRG